MRATIIIKAREGEAIIQDKRKAGAILENRTGIMPETVLKSGCHIGIKGDFGDIETDRATVAKQIPKEWQLIRFQPH